MTSVDRSEARRPASVTGPPPQAEAILEKAAEAFAERGFATTSMSELAAACNVSKALLYHYYESKEAILFDLLDRYMARLVAIVARVRAERLAPRPRLHALVRAFLAEYESSRTRHVALVNDARLLGTPQRERIVAQER